MLTASTFYKNHAPQYLFRGATVDIDTISHAQVANGTVGARRQVWQGSQKIYDPDQDLKLINL